MELFKQNGHLTNDGIQAIINESLNELERLEAAEHLSFCDLCLTKYTAALENAPLLSVPHDFAPEVVAYANNRKLKYLITRVGTLAAGFAIAMTLWTSGVFTNFIPVADFAKEPAAAEVKSNPVSTFFEDISGAIGGVFDMHRNARQSEEQSILQKKQEQNQLQNAAQAAPADLELTPRQKARLEEEEKQKAEIKKQQDLFKAKLSEMFAASPAKEDYLQDKDILNNLKNHQKPIGDNK